VRSEGSEQSWTDSGYPIQAFQTAECAASISVGHDDLREREANSGEPRKLGGRSGVRIDPLPLLQRPGLTHGTVTLRGRRSGSEGGEQLNLTCRLPWLGGQMPYDLPGDCQRYEEEERATLGGKHEGRYGGMAVGR
jgi:hypothetical protein